jgi:hypothetical protein
MGKERQALVPTQILKQCILWDFSPREKLLGREPGHLHLVATLIMVELYLNYQYVFNVCCLIKLRDISFVFTWSITVVR